MEGVAGRRRGPRGAIALSESLQELLQRLLKTVEAKKEPVTATLHTTKATYEITLRKT